MPSDPGFPSQGLPTVFKIFLAVFAVLFAAAFVRIVIYTVRRRQILKHAGLSPMMADVQMESRLAQSQFMMPAAPRSIELRLAELDELHQRGVISDAERAEARAKIISDG